MKQLTRPRVRKQRGVGAAGGSSLPPPSPSSSQTPAEQPQSEGMFRELAEITPAVIFIHRGGRFLYANPAALELSGYSLVEILEMNFWDIVHPAFLNLVKTRGLARHQGQDVPPRYEFKLLTKSGEERWLELSAVGIQFAGEPAVLGTAFDITERKRAEAALQESEQRYRVLAENSAVGFWQIAPDGRTIYANPAMRAILEIDTAEELVGEHFQAFAAGENAQVAEHEEGKHETGVAPTYEVDICTKRGRKRRVLVSGAPIVSTDGKLESLIGTISDVTGRRRAEEALRQSEAKYRVLVETAHDLIWACDLQGSVTFVNRAWIKLLGYTVKEIVGHPFLDRIPPTEQARVWNAFKQGLAGKPFSNFDITLLTRDGRAIHLNLNSAPLLDDEGRPIGIMGTSQDVSERTLAEAEKEQFSRRLLEAIDEERRRIARELHDNVGQSIAALGLQLHAILQEKSKEKRSDCKALLKMASQLRETAEAAAQLARDYHPADLAELGLSPAIHAFVKEFAKRHRLRCSVSVGLAHTLLTSDQALHLYRIVQEALSNVAKHAKATHVRVILSQRRQTISLLIEDDGIGIDPLLLSKPRRSLGLTSMRERAEMLGASFTLQPRNGGGTTVRIILPVAARSRPEA